jgi:uncharacterized integral membrane protein
VHERNDIASGGDGPGTWNDKRQVSPTLIGFVVIAILAIVFIVENGDKVHVRLIIPKVEMPVWVAIAIALVIGAILDRLFQAWWRRRRRDS